MSAADSDRVWDMMSKVPICMLATWDGRELHARPMGAYVRREDNTIYFLTDVRNHKDDEIQQYPKVCLAFSDTGGTYVSLSGHATVSDDRDRVRQLWSTPAKAWWDSPDDPNIRVLKVAPIEAEYWDTPGRVVAGVKMAMAAATGARPNMGENRKVAMR